jgi:hypothetical protein
LRLAGSIDRAHDGDAEDCRRGELDDEREDEQTIF